MFLLISNEPIKIAQLQKLSNQSVVNDALVIEMVTILLVKARKILIVWWSKERSNRKKKKWNKYMSIDFAIYLSYSEVQKNRKVDNV